RDAILHQPMLELEELARAMGGFAQRHDAGIADERTQWLKVLDAGAGLGGCERQRMGLEPGDHLAILCLRLRPPRGRNAGQCRGCNRSATKQHASTIQHGSLDRSWRPMPVRRRSSVTITDEAAWRSEAAWGSAHAGAGAEPLAEPWSTPRRQPARSRPQDRRTSRPRCR